MRTSCMYYLRKHNNIEKLQNYIFKRLKIADFYNISCLTLQKQVTKWKYLLAYDLLQTSSKIQI